MKEFYLVTVEKIEEPAGYAESEPLSSPPPPTNSLNSLSYTGPYCPLCGSDYPKKYWLFGKRYCVNSDCRNKIPPTGWDGITR